MTDTAPLLAPSLADIEELARAARDTLPPPFRDPASQVALRVEDFAPDALLDELEIDDAFGLTGLYDGIPLTEKSHMDQPTGPDTIWLFRRPIPRAADEDRVLRRPLRRGLRAGRPVDDGDGIEEGHGSFA